MWDTKSSTEKKSNNVIKIRIIKPRLSKRHIIININKIDIKKYLSLIKLIKCKKK